MFNFSKPIWITGHRGAAASMPENTLESIHLAFDTHKTIMVEFDVRITKDGVPVILHDAKLERTTDGRGYLSHTRLEELRSLDAGYRFDPRKDRSYPFRRKGFRIPTFEQLLIEFPSQFLAVEIKEKMPDFTRSVMALIKKHKSEDRCIVGSKHEEVSQVMRKEHPHVYRFWSQIEIVRGFLDFQRKVKPAKDPRAVASMPLERCGMHFDRADFIEYLHAKEVKSFYWTINAEEDMKQLEKRGADGFITDDPGKANSVMGRPAGTVPKAG